MLTAESASNTSTTDVPARFFAWSACSRTQFEPRANGDFAEPVNVKRLGQCLLDLAVEFDYPRLSWVDALS